jgi:hypothetical protein
MISTIIKRVMRVFFHGFFSVKFRVVCLDGDLMPITNEMDITIIVSKLNNIQLWPSCN